MAMHGGQCSWRLLALSFAGVQEHDFQIMVRWGKERGRGGELVFKAHRHRRCSGLAGIEAGVRRQVLLSEGGGVRWPGDIEEGARRCVSLKGSSWWQLDRRPSNATLLVSVATLLVSVDLCSCATGGGGLIRGARAV